MFAHQKLKKKTKAKHYYSKTLFVQWLPTSILTGVDVYSCDSMLPSAANLFTYVYNIAIVYLSADYDVGVAVVQIA